MKKFVLRIKLTDEQSNEINYIISDIISFKKSKYKNLLTWIILGMKIFWIFFWGHPKIGLVLGGISMYFGVFS